ncbi:hypothetical protein [Ensifer canadensis]|uniref:hypothetical protein n=1 Tax=Ensifer canadensis TaxID=555315 RepID=UPI0035E3D75F
MNWSPYQIKVILHHHSSAAVFEYASAPLYRPTIDQLVEAGILFEDDGSLGTTALGNALVKMWCETPLPVRVFVDPRTFGEAA